MEGLGGKFPPNFLRLHVFADGFRAEASSDLLPGNLPCVPHVGHVRATLLQIAVCIPPALVPRLRVELARFAPGVPWRVARVRCRRRIDQLPNQAGVHCVLAVVVLDQLCQRHRLIGGDQGQVTVGS